MRRADLAEAILSLSSPPERAASMVGDFLEDDPGALRFWVLVGRTAMAQTGREITRRPTALAGLAIRGMIVEFGYALAACLAYLACLYIAICVEKVIFHADVPD